MRGWRPPSPRGLPALGLARLGLGGQCSAHPALASGLCPENLPRALVHFSADICAPTCPAKTSQAPGEDRWQMRAGAPVWVGCSGLLEPLGMGTEGQGQPLGVRPVSVRVAMPLQRADGSLGTMPTLPFHLPPPSQPVGLGHSC